MKRNWLWLINYLINSQYTKHWHALYIINKITINSFFFQYICILIFIIGNLIPWITFTFQWQITVGYYINFINNFYQLTITNNNNQNIWKYRSVRALARTETKFCILHKLGNKTLLGLGTLWAPQVGDQVVKPLKNLQYLA